MMNILPTKGIDNRSRDNELAVENGVSFLRDIVNFNVTRGGVLDMRKGLRKVSDKSYRFIWRSPLHGDTFALFGGKWVKVDTLTWNHEELADVGSDWAYHAVVNNMVVVSTVSGVYGYNGQEVLRMSVDEPPKPYVSDGSGSVAKGTYKIAISRVVRGIESGIGSIAYHETDGLGFDVHFAPQMMECDAVNVYLSRADGSEMYKVASLDSSETVFKVSGTPSYGRLCQFQYKRGMIGGRYLCYWKGRLVNSLANVIYFSDAQAYHLNDTRYGFVQMPQRVTFLIAVEGGLWVGQSNGVVFLRGSSPEDFVFERKAVRKPVKDSAIIVGSEFVGADASGGHDCAMWLSENGYVIGTASGGIIELHSNIMLINSNNLGSSAITDGRIYTQSS